MGALLAFELARELREQALRSPRLLCVSAAPAPHLPRRSPALSRMSNEQLVAELRAWNGTPEAILANGELMHLLLPTIRADLEVVEGYTYRALPPLECPLLILGGKQDRTVAHDDLVGWGEHTLAGSTLVEVDGDHFFLHSADALGTVKASIDSLHGGAGAAMHSRENHAHN
jgi:medium-chain acyl-[acyl-carrier-protein] hydrolase